MTGKVNFRRLSFLGACAIGTTSLCLGSLALAEQTAQATDQLQEITVTARQVKESLQDVPVAVTAIGEAQLDRTFAKDLRDLGAYSPNVQIGTVPGFNAASIAIRGVSTGDIPSTFDPAVSVALDGFYLGHFQGSLLDVFDIEQVQILRGPQGTLFGKNTIGGVVLVSSKKPTGKLDLETKVRVGNYGRHDFMAAADLPIVQDKLSARIALEKFNSDGFFKNAADNNRSFGGQDLLAGRGKLLWTPNDDFDAMLALEFGRDRSDTPPIINTSTPNDPNGYYGSDVLALPAFIPLCCRGTLSPLGNPFYTAQLPIDNAVPGLAAQKNTKGHWEDTKGLYLTTHWRVADGEMTAIVGSRKVDSDYYNDYIASTIAGYETIRSTYRKTTSAEVRFAANLTSQINYVAGVFYQDNKVNYENQTGLGSLLTGGAPLCECNDFVITSPDGSRSAAVSGNGGQVTKSYALFGEANYKFTDATRLTAGVRWSKDKKDFNLRPIGAAFALAADNNAVISVDKSQSWSDTTFRVGLDHKFAPDVLGYLTFSTGFKSGGYNEQATTLSSAALSFNPEKATSVELGAKTELLNRRLRLNTALFWVKYKDLQLDSVVEVPVAPFQESVITNAGKSTSYGLEIEANALVTDKLSIDGTFGYLHAKYDQYSCDLPGDTVSGNVDCSALTVKRAPKYQGSLGATYSLPVSFGAVNFNSNWTYTDKFYNDILDSEASAHEAVGLLNASAELVGPEKKWRASVYGRNLTNKYYQASGLGVARLWSFSTYGAPRTYGLELDYKFR